MTPEMAFECLLVSDDPAVLTTMDPILHDLSISTNVCRSPLRTGSWPGEASADLFVIDLEAVGSAELLRHLRELQHRRKPTLLALSGTDCSVPDVHVILRKPVTPESGSRSLRVAYSKMLQDFRKHTRFALMTPVIASDERNRTYCLTVTNIGAGGVGLVAGEKIEVGSVLSFQIKLPELESELSVRARVLWNRESGIAGCEFVHMPVFDAQLLHAWLESRYRIKKPLISLG
jgi:hypothetical protein